MPALEDSIRFVKGVGPKKAAFFEKLHIRTLRDALETYPRDYEDRSVITSIADIIEELSSGMTLLPGTIIATGTPAGVGMGFDPPKFLKPGDVVECSIEGIGTLRNTVR